MVNMGGDRSPERARQDYIKVIYQLGERKPVRAAELARYLGVSRASVSKFKRMLEREKLLARSHGRTDALRLTEKGQRLALRMVRRHRLVETFLHKTLGVPLEQVHSEAERIEHAISDDVSSRLATFLANPTADPHGHRIPAHLPMKAVTDLALTSVLPGEEVVVTSIDDHDATAVAELSLHNVLPGKHLVVGGGDETFVRVRVGPRTVRLSARAAAGLRCARINRVTKRRSSWRR